MSDYKELTDTDLLDEFEYSEKYEDTISAAETRAELFHRLRTRKEALAQMSNALAACEFMLEWWKQNGDGWSDEDQEALDLARQALNNGNIKER